MMIEEESNFYLQYICRQSGGLAIRNAEEHEG